MNLSSLKALYTKQCKQLLAKGWTSDKLGLYLEKFYGNRCAVFQVWPTPNQNYLLSYFESILTESDELYYTDPTEVYLTFEELLVLTERIHLAFSDK